MTDPFAEERHTADWPGTPPKPLGERRRLLVGDLVIRRMSYRSVARVALPVFALAYLIALALGLVAWNVGSAFGWTPDPDQPDGDTVFWSAVGAGVVVVPFAWLSTLGLTALYNGVSRWTGGIEIAIVSPRAGHHHRGAR